MEKAQISRREVLAVAAAGAASLAVASSGFAAAPRQEGPLKWGIIGTGTRGAGFGAALERPRRVRDTASGS